MDVLVVCLPTYNERENLEAMVSALGEVLPDDGRVLVIDDNSPDGTGEIADRLASERDDVAVLVLTVDPERISPRVKLSELQAGAR